MFNEMSKSMYRQIVELELTFLEEFKMNPFDLFGGISVKDLVTYMMALTNKIEAKNNAKRSKVNGKDLMGALGQIRDILNYMYS